MSSRILPDYNQLMRFTINDVCNWLGENRFGEFVRMFREHGIDGNRFVELTDLDLTKIGCPMNKRRDLLKLIKELPKPEPSRVRNVIQQRAPATPDRDYQHKTRQTRPPPPLPSDPQPQTNSDESESEDEDCQWYSDFESSEEEDYMNPSHEVEDMQWKQLSSQPPDAKDHMSGSQSSDSLVDKLKSALISRQKVLQGEEDEAEDSDGSAASYEEPDPQAAPPVVPGRPGVLASRGGKVPVNRRPIPQTPKEEDQPVYEETNEEDNEQPVYEDPDEQQQQKPQPVKKTDRKQLPVPGDLGKKIPPMPSRMTSEPDVPAPPPPRGRGKPSSQSKSNKSTEHSAPTPPPPRGGRKAQPPVPEPVQEDFYEDPDNQPQQSANQNEPTEFYWEPLHEHDTPTPPSTFQEAGVQKDDFYEDPDHQPQPVTSVRRSALPPLPTEQHHTPPPVVEQQDVYEDPDATPSQPPQPQPPPPRNSRNRVLPTPPQNKVHQPKKKVSEPEFQQQEYEVPEEILKGEIPQEDYMAMAPVPPKITETAPVKKEEKTSTLPPRPAGRRGPVPSPAAEPPKSERSHTDHRTKSQAVSNDSSVSLEDQVWYHGEIERSIADSKLLGVGANGCYLIRRSKKGGETKPYTLAILYENQVFNLNIRKKPNNKFALGMVKKDEQEFSDLMELVAFFNSHRLILAKGQTRLKTPCPK